MANNEERTKKLLAEPFDPIYRELTARLTDAANSEIIPRIMAKLLNLQQAKIVNSLPASPEEIARKLNVDVNTVNKTFQEAYEKGFLFPGKSGWHFSRSWHSLRDTIGASNSKHMNDDLLALMFVQDNVIKDERKKLKKEMLAQGKTPVPGMRVVPRWRAIKDIPGVLPCEDVRQLVKGTGPYGMINCPCKVINDPICKDHTIPVRSCTSLHRAGDYNIKRGAAKEFTYEGLMDYLDSLDKYQVVHMTGNSNGPQVQLCNCHNDCCGMFRDQSFAKSRFVAEVDPAKCKACRLCVDKRCPVGAAQMKQYPGIKGERSYTNADTCIGCGLCVVSCPNGARKLKIVRPPEYIPEPGLAEVA
jgi:NAD-dependent dihydropyrimidine dehydrogenase PreA subunit